MNNNMTVKEINIETIINEKIRYIKDCDDEECRNVNRGGVAAYYDMLEDTSTYSVDEFVEKYLNVLRELHNNIESDIILPEKDMEVMCGYNNAIVEVLRLINPIYEFEL